MKDQVLIFLCSYFGFISDGALVGKGIYTAWIYVGLRRVYLLEDRIALTREKHDIVVTFVLRCMHISNILLFAE